MGVVDLVKKEGIWTIEAMAIHYQELRLADRELDSELRKADHELAAELRLADQALARETDRRYTEGNELRARALKIKETADRDALELDRASQTYKEARNDALREQNLKETGIYATRDDLAMVVTRIEKTLKPLADFVSAQQGATKGSQITMGKIFASIAATGTIIGIVISISVFLTK